MSQASRYSTMLDGNVLLRQKRDEVPEGTLSCPDRNMEVFNQLRHYEGLRLLPSVCGWKLIQQTLIMYKMRRTSGNIHRKVARAFHSRIHAPQSGRQANRGGKENGRETPSVSPPSVRLTLFF